MELCGRERDMVWIPPGAFFYGDAKDSCELPGFWIDRTPVTNAAYQSFINANCDHPVPFARNDWALPYNWDRERRGYPVGKAHHPVTLVAWYDALAYAEWAGGRVRPNRSGRRQLGAQMDASILGARGTRVAVTRWKRG